MKYFNIIFFLFCTKVLASAPETQTPAKEPEEFNIFTFKPRKSHAFGDQTYPYVTIGNDGLDKLSIPDAILDLKEAKSSDFIVHYSKLCVRVLFEFTNEPYSEGIENRLFDIACELPEFFIFFYAAKKQDLILRYVLDSALQFNYKLANRGLLSLIKNTRELSSTNFKSQEYNEKLFILKDNLRRRAENDFLLCQEFTRNMIGKRSNGEIVQGDTGLLDYYYKDSNAKDKHAHKYTFVDLQKVTLIHGHLAKSLCKKGHIPPTLALSKDLSVDIRRSAQSMLILMNSLLYPRTFSVFAQLVTRIKRFFGFCGSVSKKQLSDEFDEYKLLVQNIQATFLDFIDTLQEIQCGARTLQKEDACYLQNLEKLNARTFKIFALEVNAINLYLYGLVIHVIRHGEVVTANTMLLLIEGLCSLLKGAVMM